MSASASVSHLTNGLVLLSSPSQPQALSAYASSSETTRFLRSLYVSLKPPLSNQQVTTAVFSLQNHELNHTNFNVETTDEEEATLRHAVLGRISVGLYADAMNILLKEASDADVEANWWAEVERSRLNAGYYFIQSAFALTHQPLPSV